MIVIGAKRWFQFTSVGVICALFSGAMVGLWRHTPGPPELPKPLLCKESAELRTQANGSWDCDPPAHVEIYATNTYSSSGLQISLFKCVCGGSPKFTIEPFVVPEPVQLKEPELKIK